MKKGTVRNAREIALYRATTQPPGIFLNRKWWPAKSILP
jgi:hypothetical protein